MVLPTIDVNADGEEMVSEVLRLDVGTYSVVRYIAYNNKGDQIHDMYLPESGDNTFVIQHEEAVAFYFPVNILEVQSADMLKNKLFGLCTEILGPDSTLWPKTWREEMMTLRLGKIWSLRKMVIIISFILQVLYLMRNLRV